MEPQDLPRSAILNSGRVKANRMSKSTISVNKPRLAPGQPGQGFLVKPISLRSALLSQHPLLGVRVSLLFSQRSQSRGRGGCGLQGAEVWPWVDTRDFPSGDPPPPGAKTPTGQHRCAPNYNPSPSFPRTKARLRPHRCVSTSP